MSPGGDGSLRPWRTHLTLILSLGNVLWPLGPLRRGGGACRKVGTTDWVTGLPAVLLWPGHQGVRMEWLISSPSTTSRALQAKIHSIQSLVYWIPLPNPRTGILCFLSLLPFLEVSLRKHTNPQCIPKEDGSGFTPLGISHPSTKFQQLCWGLPGGGGHCVICLVVIPGALMPPKLCFPPALTGLFSPLPVPPLPRHVGALLRPGKHQRRKLLCERGDHGAGAHDVSVEHHQVPEWLGAPLPAGTAGLYRQWDCLLRAPSQGEDGVGHHRTEPGHHSEVVQVPNHEVSP